MEKITGEIGSLPNNYKQDFVYSPHLTFSSPSLEKKIRTEYERLLEKDPLKGEMAWLSTLYAQDVEKGAFEPLEIRFINSCVGYGAYATRDIPSKTFLGEYGGRVCWKLIPRKNPYCFDYPISFWGVSAYVDAKKQGNLFRFLNHSPKGNVEFLTVLIQGIPRILFRTCTPVKKGEQLVFNYFRGYWKKASFLSKLLG